MLRQKCRVEQCRTASELCWRQTGCISGVCMKRCASQAKYHTVELHMKNKSHKIPQNRRILVMGLSALRVVPNYRAAWSVTWQVQLLLRCTRYSNKKHGRRVRRWPNISGRITEVNIKPCYLEMCLHLTVLSKYWADVVAACGHSITTAILLSHD